MKKALIIGVDHYNEKHQNLNFCRESAKDLSTFFSRNYDKNDIVSEPNFSCKTLLSSNNRKQQITRSYLKRNLKELFEDDESDIALFSYSGYGFQNELGLILGTQDTEVDDEGVAFEDIMIYANNSSIKEIVIILDLHVVMKSKNIVKPLPTSVMMRKGVSVLISYNEWHSQKENDNFFSQLICDTLEGGYSDIFGHIKITDLYEQADRILSPVGHKIVFRTNTSRLSVLRKVKPQVAYSILKKMVVYFRGPEYRFPLDPAYVPSQGHKNLEKEQIFKELQKLSKNGLIIPVNEKHMYYAGVNGTYCKLTAKGKQYWELIKKNRI